MCEIKKEKRLLKAWEKWQNALPLKRDLGKEKHFKRPINAIFNVNFKELFFMYNITQITDNYT